VIPILRVHKPGLHTTVQDLGRYGLQSMGVPVSGALDTTALRIANHLVGNEPTIAALEVLGAGPVLEVTTESVRIAVGLNFSRRIAVSCPRLRVSACTVVMSFALGRSPTWQ